MKNFSKYAASSGALLVALLLSTGEVASGESPSVAAPLNQANFLSPPQQYRPIDCWWWDGAYLSEEKLRSQIDDMHAKGVGGTWLYPRFGASQSMSSEPGFWTDGWWDFVRFALKEHERVGMVQWANDWIGRLDKNYFQNLLRAERDANPILIGYRLGPYQKISKGAETIQLRFRPEEVVLSAAAYRLIPGETDAVDGETRIDLLKSATNEGLSWDAPGADWLVIAVTSQRNNLDYLGPAVAKRWIEIFFDQYQRKLGDQLGKSLTAYGPDERFVLDGNVVYADSLRDRFKRDKGYDPLPELPAIFIDIGDKTSKIRCDYYDVMVTLLEENLYAPISRWLHEHGMKQATVATWGRENMLGQVSNYGDFFRMMRHFDIPGNEDSVQSGAHAFIDGKLSSSIAHLNGRSHTVACGYWGTGWGFTQEENLKRTSVNYALGITILNTHGGLYSLMGGRNEFVPPEVHFFQPYWQTWRAYSDYASRLSYALSQGAHRADVALIYPVSTLHAHWRGASNFDPAARVAQDTCFALAKVIYPSSLDFDFIDEASVVAAKIEQGKLKPAALEFPVVVLPTMSTIRLDAAEQLRKFVAAGGTLVVYGSLALGSAEHGRNDPALRKLWTELLGDFERDSANVVQKSNSAGGRTILVRSGFPEVASLIRKSITPDVQTDAQDVDHTHQQLGDRHIYYFVNRRPERRVVEVTVRCHGIPEIWNALTGEIKPLHRFDALKEGTKIRLSMDPNAGVLVVMKPTEASPEIVSDTLASIDEIHSDGDGYKVVGTTAPGTKPAVRIEAHGRTYAGEAALTASPKPISLDGMWECEYRPTMDNRWGDYRYPAAKEWIGPETPRMKYRREKNSGGQPDWQISKLDESDWQEVAYSFGPYWQMLGPFEQPYDSDKLQAQLVENPEETATNIGGQIVKWEPYTYSWKYGVDRMDIHQQPGDDGLGPVSENTLVFDRPMDGVARICYLATRVFAQQTGDWFLHFGMQGDNICRQAWVNGKPVIDVTDSESKAIERVRLDEGANDVLLRIVLPHVDKRDVRPKRGSKGIPPVRPSNGKVATFAVFQSTAALEEPPRYMPLSRWYATSSELTFDCEPATEECIGWFRLSAPPGANSAKLKLQAESVQAWVDGQKAEFADGVLHFPSSPSEDTSVRQVALRVKHKRGYYDGAAFEAPVSFNCGRGKIVLGDWCTSGLQYYSGGVTYIKTVEVSSEQLAQQVTLDLGDVRTSAEVTVNGKPLGVRLARPFTFDVSKFLKPGKNEIRVQVLNTLANYMSAQPTRYVFDGQTKSGLLGPVTLDFAAKTTVLCTPVTEPSK